MSSVHLNYSQLPLLAGLLLVALCIQAQAHDRLPNRPQNRRDPPAIYTISADAAASEQGPLSSHRLQRPYSWNNRRLAKQLVQADEAEHEGRLWPESGEQSGESERQQQLGDLSLLYSHAKSAPRSPANRWPAVKGVGSPAGRRRATKGRAGAPGTKSLVGRERPAGSPAPGAAAAAAAAAAPASPTNSSRPRSAAKRKNLVCYYGTWAVYRPDAGKFPVESIDPFLCTHVIYGFTGLSYDNLIKPLDPWNDLEDNYGKGAMKRFTNLKRINPDLKTLVAIGGWNEGSIKYSKMASEPESRARFVASVVAFLERFNFDGLDLDWEYPGSRGGSQADKQNFVLLLRELSAAFRPRGYLLSAAVSAGKWFIEPAYDIPEVGRLLDLINLMAYDYHGGWETKTGLNAPLFASARHERSAEERTLNVNWSVNYWLAHGAPREKLMLGVGSYGRSFTLDSAQLTGIGAPASQKGQAGPYTREPGSLGYNELCESFKQQPKAWTIVRDPDYLAPYAFSGRQWVGYDDRESLALKAQFAKSLGLGGMMMWSLETDDFHGRCHDEKYPLLNTLRRVLDNGGGPPPEPPQPPRPPPRPPQPPSQPAKPRPTGQPPTGRPGPQTSRRPQVTPGPAPGTTSTAPSTGTSTGAGPARTSTTSTTRRPAQTTPGLEVEDERPRPTQATRPNRPGSTRRPAGSGHEFECRAEGMFADPRSCRKFIRCVSAGPRFQTFKFDCAPGTAFDQAQQLCDYIHNVPSCAAPRGQPAHHDPAQARQLGPLHSGHQFSAPSVRHVW